MAKGRRLELGPQACAVVHDEDDLARRCQDAPDLAQERSQRLGVLDKMGHDDPVNAGIRQRDGGLIDERRQVRRMWWPVLHTLLGWHEAEGACGLGAEWPQVGMRVANAGDGFAAHGRPEFAQTPSDELCGCLPETGFVKGLQFPCVKEHRQSCPTCRPSSCA
jgi:hypothetical protein